MTFFHRLRNFRVFTQSAALRPMPTTLAFQARLFARLSRITFHFTVE